jgi:hypothetical protein
MKKVTIGLILGIALLLTACVSESATVLLNHVEKKKESKVREKATIDISKMPIQTYEEYIKLKKFVLGKYIKELNSTLSSGVAYLKDGTKIKYYFDKREVSESIYHIKKPFVEVMKMYYVHSKNIKIYREFLFSILIGDKFLYDERGSILKKYDKDAELKSLGLDYKKILEWANEQGIIDLKTSMILKGSRIELHKSSFKKNWKTDWSEEEKRVFQEKTHLSDKVIKNFFSHSHYWDLTVDFPRYMDYYMFSADGSFVDYTGRIYKQ